MGPLCATSRGRKKPKEVDVGVQLSTTICIRIPVLLCRSEEGLFER